MFIEKTETTKGPLGAPVFTVTTYVVTIPIINKKIKLRIVRNNSAPGIWVVFFVFFIFAAVTSAVICITEKDEAINEWSLVAFTFFITFAAALFGHNILNKS